MIDDNEGGLRAAFLFAVTGISTAATANARMLIRESDESVAA